MLLSIYLIFFANFSLVFAYKSVAHKNWVFITFSLATLSSVTPGWNWQQQNSQLPECLNLTEAIWAPYICNHENNVSSRLSPQSLCGNSSIWTHDVRALGHLGTWFKRTSCAQVHGLPQSHRSDAHCFYHCIYIYICIYICIYIYIYMYI